MGKARKRIGHYVLEKELGKGGMGVVYRAHDERLKRTVALKTILPGVDDAPEAIARFRREAEAVARLRHPHIVTVHELGEDDGQAFIAMEYVAGVTLSKRLATKGSQPITRRRAVEVVRDVARAVQHAHEQGVIHRDLKPQNVLLAADDHAFVVDFGLARLRGARTKLTRTGQAMGTPAYMPPEQARGETVDERSDVYSLGATLYHALAGRPPFDADGEIQVLAQVLTKAATRPSAHVKDVPRDLDAICLRALEKTPGLRYESAAAFADDLDRWLEGKPVHATLPNDSAETARVASHVVLLALFLVAGVAGVVFAAAGRRTPADPSPHVESPEDRSRRLAAEQERARLAAAESAKALEAKAEVERRSALHEWNADGGLPPETQRFQSSRLLTLRLVAGTSTDAEYPSSAAWCLAVSGDGRFALTGHSDGVGRVFDLSTGKLVARLALPFATPGESREVTAVAIGREGTRALVASATRFASFQLPEGERLTAIELPERSGVALAFTDLGPRALVSGRTELRLLDATGKERWKHVGGDARLVLAPDGSQALALHADGKLHALDLETGHARRDPVGWSWHVPLALSPDGSRVIWTWSGNPSERFGLGDAAQAKPVLWSKPEDDVTHAAFSPDGKTCAAIEWSRSGKNQLESLVLLSVPTGVELDRLDVSPRSALHREARPSVAFTPDGRGLVVARSDGSLLRFAVGAEAAARAPDDGALVASLAADVPGCSTGASPSSREALENGVTLLEQSDRTKRAAFASTLLVLRQDRPLGAVPLLLEALLVLDPIAEKDLVQSTVRAFTILTGYRVETECSLDELRRQARDLAVNRWAKDRSGSWIEFQSMDPERVERAMRFLVEEVPGFTRSPPASDGPVEIEGKLAALAQSRGQGLKLPEHDLGQRAIEAILLGSADRAYRYPSVALLAHLTRGGASNLLFDVRRARGVDQGTELVAYLAHWAAGRPLPRVEVEALVEKSYLSVDVREAYLIALALAQDPAAAGALKAALADKSGPVRGAAALGLCRLVPATALALVGPLLDAATEPEEISALLRAIALTHNPAVPERIARFLARALAGDAIGDAAVGEAVTVYENATGWRDNRLSATTPRDRATAALEDWKKRSKGVK